MENPTLLETAFTFEYSAATVKDGGGPGQDLNFSRTSTLPSLLAVSLFSAPESRNKFVFSILTRQEADIRARMQRVLPFKAMPDGSPSDASAAEWMNDTRLSETWAGLTWAYSGNDKIGIGISSYFALRNQKSRLQTVTQDYWADRKGDASVFIDDFDYWHLRLLAKLGICFDLSPLVFGFTVTTPSLSLLGDGKSFINIYSSDPIFTDSENTYLASNSQMNLKVNYKTSWALAAGMSYQVSSTTLHFSAEWFDAVDRYKIITREPFQGQSTGETFEVDLYQALKTIINYGVGLEHHFHESLTLYASFITDFSAFSDDSDISITTHDIYHITLGSAFRIAQKDLTIGLGYSWGNGLASQVAGTSWPDSEDTLPVLEEDKPLNYYRIKFMLGLSF
jgi:hypothetical protein